MQTFIAVVLIVASLGSADCSTRPVAAPQNSQSPAPEISQNKGKPTISLRELEEMFARMRAETKWNLDGDMLWGYFFTDPSADKLKPVAEHLGRNGYHVVDTYETDDKSGFVLHVERVERHTPQTLHARNAELYSLAEQFNIESYDGMDVGPVKKN